MVTLYKNNFPFNRWLEVLDDDGESCNYYCYVDFSTLHDSRIDYLTVAKEGNFHKARFGITRVIEVLNDMKFKEVENQEVFRILYGK